MQKTASGWVSSGWTPGLPQEAEGQASKEQPDCPLTEVSPCAHLISAAGCRGKEGREREEGQVQWGRLVLLCQDQLPCPRTPL